jgi:hypothetical protein
MLLACVPTGDSTHKRRQSIGETFLQDRLKIDFDADLHGLKEFAGSIAEKSAARLIYFHLYPESAAPSEQRLNNATTADADDRESTFSKCVPAADDTQLFS